MKYINVIIIVFYCSTTYCQSTGYVLQKLDGTTNLPDSAISIGKITGIKQWLANNLKTINGSNLWGGTNLVITGVDTAVHSTKANVQKIKDSVVGLYGSDYRAANFTAGTNYLAPAGNGSALTGLTASQVSLGNVNNTSDAAKPVSTAQQTALDAKQATLVSGSNIKTVNGTTLLGSTDIVTTRKVATADIAATASATSTTTLFTPSASGFYRVSIYLKISTTGTSPVAGPVTITYTEPDGSVAQSHVMLLQSVTGTVVTTTVNNSTTTGTVNGSIIIYAKTGVAIQYAIAVSGTFGSGRYIAHLTCEQL